MMNHGLPEWYYNSCSHSECNYYYEDAFGHPLRASSNDGALVVCSHNILLQYGTDLSYLLPYLILQILSS